MLTLATSVDGSAGEGFFIGKYYCRKHEKRGGGSEQAEGFRNPDQAAGGAIAFQDERSHGAARWLGGLSALAAVGRGKARLSGWIAAPLQDGRVEIGDELNSRNIQLGQLLVAGEKQIDARRSRASQVN